MAVWYEQTGWVVALTGGASTLLTLACTKGVDALLRLRKARQEEVMEDRKYDDSQEAVAFKEATAAYKMLIQAFEVRVHALETALAEVNAELKETRSNYVKAIMESAELRGELKVYVERFFAHDENNKKHLEVLTEKLQQVEGGKSAP